VRNRVNRHACLDHSVRHRQEAQALRHALRDPIITAMYDSREWHELRKQVRSEARGRCEWLGCKREGFCVDHRTPHKGAPSLFFERSNLWLLCKLHHDRKTALHDGGFGREVRPFTWPMRGPSR
jgi:5-methylcytosine-specific restriction endonuclease McrA